MQGDPEERVRPDEIVCSLSLGINLQYTHTRTLHSSNDVRKRVASADLHRMMTAVAKARESLGPNISPVSISSRHHLLKSL